MKAPGCSSLAYVYPALISSISLLAFDLHSAQTAGTNVSYFQQIRPILQANCQGCHQPAKAKGGYVMTDFEKLVGKGDTGEACVVSKAPEKSLLFKQITPVKGEAEMPKGKPPLLDPEIELVRRWIAEGAVDDTPANAEQRFDMDPPPIYTRPPVITSLDFSPDGKFL